MDNFSALPEGCISQILSMTSPRDACRSSLLSSGFHAAATSDAVWEIFLPSDYRQILSRSVSPVVVSTKKQLYFSLCESPLLLDSGKLSFTIDRESGKKCYTLPARELAIAWKDDCRYWTWISLPESRFPEVAQLLHVWWLDIWGTMNTAMLSPNTAYAAYLIFKITDLRNSGLELLPVNASIRFVKEGEDEYEGGKNCTVCTTVFLSSGMSRSQRRAQNRRLPRLRKDRWMEIELGEFCTDEDNDGEVLEMRLREVKSLKSRLLVEGIEVRPSSGDQSSPFAFED